MCSSQITRVKMVFIKFAFHSFMLETQKKRKLNEAAPFITTAAPAETKEKISVVVVFHEKPRDGGRCEK